MALFPPSSLLKITPLYLLKILVPGSELPLCPHPAAILSVISPVWTTHPAHCFQVPLSPQIQWHSPHFTSLTHTYSSAIGLIFTLDISPTPKTWNLTYSSPPCAFPHPIASYSNDIRDLISSPCLFLLPYPTFIFGVTTPAALADVLGSMIHCLSLCPRRNRGPDDPRVHCVGLRAGLSIRSASPQVHVLPASLTSPGRQEERRLPPGQTAEPLVKASLILYLLLSVEEVLDQI